MSDQDVTRVSGVVRALHAWHCPIAALMMRSCVQVGETPALGLS